MSMSLFAFNEWAQPTKIRLSESIDFVRSSVSVGDGVMVAWVEFSEKQYKIKAQFYGNAGEQYWDESGVILNTSSDNIQIEKMIKCSDNSVIIIWLNNHSQRLIQKISYNGSLNWNPVQVNYSYPNSDEEYFPDNAGGLYFTNSEYLKHIDNIGNIEVLMNLSNVLSSQIYYKSIQYVDDECFIISFSTTTGTKIAIVSLQGELISINNIDLPDIPLSIYSVKNTNEEISFVYKSINHMNLVNINLNYEISPVYNLNNLFQNVQMVSDFKVIDINNDKIMIAYLHDSNQLYTVLCDYSGNNIWTAPVSICNDVSFNAYTSKDFFLKCKDNDIYLVYSQRINYSNLVKITKITQTGQIEWSGNPLTIFDIDSSDIYFNTELIQNGINISMFDRSEGNLYTQFVTNQGIPLYNSDQILINKSVNTLNDKHIKILSTDNKAFTFWADNRKGEICTYYQIVDSEGINLFEENGKKLYQNNFNTFEDACVDNNGNIVALITEGFGDNKLYKLFVINANGDIISSVNGIRVAEEHIVDPLSPDDFNTQLSVIDNDYYVYWNSENFLNGFINIKGQRIHNMEIMWGYNGKIVVDKTNNNNNLENNNTYLIRSNFEQNLIAWNEIGNDVTISRILLLDQNGDPQANWSAQGLKIMSDSFTDYRLVDSKSSPDGIYCVVRHDQNNITNNYLQLINTNGEYAVSEPLLITSELSFQVYNMLYNDNILTMIFRDQGSYIFFQQFKLLVNIEPVQYKILLYSAPNSDLVNPVTFDYMHNRLLSIKNINNALAMNMYDPLGQIIGSSYVIFNFGLTADLSAYTYSKINNSEYLICYLKSYLYNNEIVGNDICIQRLSTSSITSEDIDTPQNHAISNIKNYPNPFNPNTEISFDLKQDSKVEIAIYNIKGQKVNTLFDSMLKAGHHQLHWNSTDSNAKKVCSGVYLYQIKTSNDIIQKKMLLLK